MNPTKLAYFNADTAVQKWLRSYEQERLWIVGWLPYAELDDPIDIDWEGSGFLTSELAIAHAEALARQMPDYAFVIYKDTEEPIWIMRQGCQSLHSHD